jgi:hypothetical protein
MPGVPRVLLFSLDPVSREWPHCHDDLTIFEPGLQARPPNPIHMID